MPSNGPNCATSTPKIGPTTSALTPTTRRIIKPRALPDQEDSPSSQKDQTIKKPTIAEVTVGSPPLFGQCPNARSVGLAGTGTATVADVLLAISDLTGPARLAGVPVLFILHQVRLAHQASLLGRLIRLLGDGGHYRDGISGVLANS